MPLSQYDSTDELAQAIVQTFSDPVTIASRWYSYYYLTEVHGIERAAFDLSQLTTKLYHAFYDYSIYAAHRELANKETRYRLYGTMLISIYQKADRQQLADSLDQEEVKMIAGISPNIERDDSISTLRQNVENMLRRSFSNHPYVQSNSNSLSPDRLVDVLTRTHLQHPMGGGLEEVKDALDDYEKETQAFSKPDRALKTASALFQITPGPNDEVKAASGWESQYGGQPWSGVCDSALKYNTLPKRAYVDLMFSVEHNGGNFLDKTETDREQIRDNADQTVADLHPEVHSKLTDHPRLDKKRYTSHDVYSRIMPLILDLARAEEMETLLRIASNSDPQIRRWSRKAGITW